MCLGPHTPYTTDACMLCAERQKREELTTRKRPKPRPIHYCFIFFFFRSVISSAAATLLVLAWPHELVDVHEPAGLALFPDLF